VGEYSHLQETDRTGPSVAETEVLVNQMSFLGQVAEAEIQSQNIIRELLFNHTGGGVV